MARGRSVIIGGGIQAAGVLGVGAILAVASVDPPQAEIASPTITEATFPRATHLIVGQSNTILGVGRYTTAGFPGVIIMGKGIEVQSGAGTANTALVIGHGAIMRSTGNTVIANVLIGQGSSIIQSTGISNCTVVGALSSDTGGVGCTLVGAAIANAAQFNTLVGFGIAMSGSSASENTVVGNQAVMSGAKNVYVGAGSGGVSNVGQQNVVIGYGATSTTDNNIVIGSGSNAPSSFTSCIIIGGAVAAYASNVCMIGNNIFSGFINEMCVGQGNTNSAPVSVKFRLTNASGTDKAGGALTLQSGLGTGAGTGGAINLNVGVVTGTSAVLQVSRTGVSVQFSSTAADTYLLVYDVNGAALKRVSVGANDSGGAGFKVLRIAN